MDNSKLTWFAVTWLLPFFAFQASSLHGNSDFFAIINTMPITTSASVVYILHRICLVLMENLPKQTDQIIVFELFLLLASLAEVSARKKMAYFADVKL